jgi:FkbM family methyltransferase
MTRYAKDSRIIFDLGTNDGEDTAFYLKRGFNVVALEANPVLCDKGRQRFRNEISQGRLSLLNVAIANRPGQAKFYVNLENDHWSSLNAEWAGRDATKFKEISVECVTVRSLFAEFGVPYYLKIDVEGADQSVLEQLRHVDTLPLFVSVEDCRLGFDYMRIMASCGYNAFKLLDQSGIAQMTDAATGHAFPAGSSGPFGDDLPGEWLPYDEMVKHYSQTVRDRAGNRLAPRSHWWDIHCTSRG